MRWKTGGLSLLVMLVTLGVLSFSHLVWGGRPLAEVWQQNLYVLLGGRSITVPTNASSDPVRQVLAEENRRLRETLALSSRLPGTVLAARVARREPQTWWSQLQVEFVIPGGKTVPAPAIVLTPQGVIGRLEHDSVATFEEGGQMLARGTVELLSSPQTQLSVVVGEKETPFLLEGRGGSELALRPVTSGAPTSIAVGEPIVTSGLGTLYSRGLQVAVVKDASWATFTSCSSTPAEVLLWWR